MTQEQIDKECDALIEKYYPLVHKGDSTISPTVLATTCAILHQTGIVENNERTYNCLVRYGVNDNAYRLLKSRFEDAKQILETLKSRVK
jgi:hypothetical protein